MSDTVVFRHLADKYDTKVINTCGGYFVEFTSNNSNYKFLVFVEDHNLPVARAVEKSPEMLQLLHEIMFCLDSKKEEYVKRAEDILKYVYSV